MTEHSAEDKLLTLFREAFSKGTLVKLTLGRYRGPDPTLRNVLVRPVALQAGLRLQFVDRHATRDLTKNLTLDEGVARLAELLGAAFGAADLFTTELAAQWVLRAGHAPRLLLGQPRHATTPDAGHDRAKKRWVDPRAAWLHALGVTGAGGALRKNRAAKFRQINRFVEILGHLMAEAALSDRSALRLVDMGCGKGYLTFAAYDWLRHSGWPETEARGLEARPALVELCNGVARAQGFGGLSFEAGTIGAAPLEALDILVALHACDTATDDALAKGIEAGASLILVAPCCHKELRPQLRPPPALAGALKHGILLERQAEFVTDALRAALLEWAGYDTRVFEFIATEHTAKNLMIAGVKRHREGPREERERQVQELAAFYGVATQKLAERLGLSLRIGAGSGRGPDRSRRRSAGGG